MNPEISPQVPEFIPHEFSAPYIEDAMRTVHGLKPRQKRNRHATTGPSATAALARDLLLAITLALVLFTMTAGGFYLLDAAGSFAPILFGVVGVLAVAWPVYFYFTRHRGA